jgi:transcriptional regulator with XRE-family HTH domain
VRVSSIAKQSHAGRGSSLNRAIGRELRRRRVAAGLTQEALGRPLTRAFVSAVEHGHAMPSIPALLLLTDRLETPLEDFFRGVKEEMTAVYSSPHGNGEDPTSRRRR